MVDLIELTPVEKSHIELTLKEKTNGWKLGWTRPLLFLSRFDKGMQYPIIIRQIDSFVGNVGFYSAQRELDPLLEEFGMHISDPFIRDVTTTEVKTTWGGKKNVRVSKKHLCFNIERIKPKKRKRKA